MAYLTARARHLAALVILAALVLAPAAGRAAEAMPPLGIALEGYPYPYPVKLFPLRRHGQALNMAYMDVTPKQWNGKTVLLLHGRNFPASYWAPVIEALNGAGYRAIAPDQIGFGKSSKPTFDLHFDDLAANTKALLDHLGVTRVDLIAHSMGGMLAVRFARDFPDTVDRVLLVDPLGLEDYSLYVPPVSVAHLVAAEAKVTAESYRQSLKTRYRLTLPDPALDPFVWARIGMSGSAEYPRWLQCFANSAEMIHREPVIDSIPLIGKPLLFIVGGNDTVAPGKDLAAPDKRKLMGHNAQNAEALAAKMSNAQAIVYPGIGHLGFLEAPRRFDADMLAFLAGQTPPSSPKQ
jgi:pimeloyl-ACP methyl ester carboxylesterase